LFEIEQDENDEPRDVCHTITEERIGDEWVVTEESIEERHEQNSRTRYGEVCPE